VDNGNWRIYHKECKWLFQTQIKAKCKETKADWKGADTKTD